MQDLIKTKDLIPSERYRLAGIFDNSWEDSLGRWTVARHDNGHYLHQFAESLGNTVDARDPLTYNHSLEVAEVSYFLARSMGFGEEQADAVHIAGHLHDIGKIGIPDSVLKKEGPLDELEQEWIRKHPEMGAKIVEPVRVFSGAGGIADMIRHHHERYDGSGYPGGLKGSSIPVGARIIAIADTLSALLQNRPYRKGVSFDEAMEEIERCSRRQFDPAIVAVLKEIRKGVGSYFLRGRYRRRGERLHAPSLAIAS